MRLFTKYEIPAAVLRFAALFSVIAGLGACSKDVPVETHQADQRVPEMRQLDAMDEIGEVRGALSFSPADDAQILSLYSKEPVYSENIQSTKKTLESLLTENSTVANGETVLKKGVAAAVPYEKLFNSTVGELAAVIMNPNYVASTTFAGNVKMQRLLSAFNQAVVVVLQANPSFLEEKKFLSAYWNIVSYGCKKDEPVALKDCTNIRFFMTDFNTSRILQYYAWTISDDIQKVQALKAEGPEKAEKLLQEKIRKYYQVVTVSMLSTNRYVAKDGMEDLSDILYLNGAVLYVKYLSSLPKVNSNYRYISQHVDNIKSVIARVPQKLGNPRYAEALQKILANNDFWHEYSRRKVSEFSSWGPDLFVIAADPRLRSGSDIQDAIRKSLTDTDPLGDKGLLRQVDDLNASAAKGIAKNLDVTFDFQPNEYLYIADQLFRGHWNVQDASVFWSAMVAENQGISAAEKTEKKRILLTTFEKYMKFQIVRMIVKTNDFMGKISSSKDVTSQSMFKDAIEKSEQIGNEWKNMLGQVRDFETFVKRYAKESNVANELEEYKRMDRAFSNLRKNISILAVYPNMLVLSFLMAKDGFSMPIRTWWGETFNLNAEIIINWLFAQISEDPPRPWFNFGNEDKAIRKYENLYSFFFAVKTKIFETIEKSVQENGKIVDVNPKEFLKVIVEKFTNFDRLQMRTFISSLESTYRSNSQYNDTLQMCAEEQRFQSETAKGVRNPRPPVYPKTKLTFDRLNAYTFVGKDSYTDDYASLPVQSFYRQDNKDQLRKIRIFLAGSIVFLNTMIDLLDKHWESQIALEKDPGVIASMRAKQKADLKEIRDSFKEVSDLKRRIYSTILRVFNETHNCLDTIYSVERRQQYALYDLHMAHFYKVHAQMKAIREFQKQEPSDAASAEERQNWKSRLAELEQKANQELQDDAYLYAPGDVKFFDNVSAANGYTLAKWDFYLRTANYLEQVNPNISVQRPDRASLADYDMFRNANNAEAKLSFQYLDDADAFVNQIMRSINNKFVSWASYNSSFEPFNNRFQLMLELYRSNEMKVFRDDFTSCATDGEGKQTCTTNMPAGEVTEQGLVDEIFHMASMMSIDASKKIGKFGDTEATFMRRIGANKKYEEKDMKEYFLEDRSMAQQPLFDNAFRMMMATTYYLDEAKVAVSTLEAMRSVDSQDTAMGAGNPAAGSVPDATAANGNDAGELIFLSDKDQVRASTLEQFFPFVDGTFSSIQKFAAAIAKRADQDRGSFPSYIFELDLSNENKNLVTVVPTLNRDGSVEYLDPARIQDYDSMKRTFHTDTKHRFQASFAGERAP